MSYEVLARKLRPKKFSELVGQDHVVRSLTHALDNGRLHHAYLFTGTRGVGKTTIGRILAKSLNCESGVSSNNNLDLKGDEPVSMNMWGFTPVIFDYLNSMFERFLSNNINDDKSEFLIPSVINDLINSGEQHVQVLYSKSSWFGVTYKQDKPYVVQQIQNLINSGLYPQKLFPLK